MTLQVVNAFVDGPDLVVLAREAGKRTEHRFRPEYSFFVETKDLEADEEFARSLRSSRSVRALSVEDRWTRIIWIDDWVRRTMLFGRKAEQRDQPRVSSPFQERGIKTYEGDVDPVRRWFTDTGANVGKPERGYFDIESDSRVSFADAKVGRARILSLSLSDESESRTWVQVLESDDDAAERRLILAFFAKIEEWSLDQLLAWNGSFDGFFDVEVLSSRIDRLGLATDMRRLLWLDHMVLFRRMNLNSSDSGEEKQSLKIGSVGQAQIGEGKEEIPDFVAARWPGKGLGELAWQLWEAGGEFRELLGRYNLKDTILMARIERHTGYVALFDTLADVCRVLPDSRGLLPTQQMDGFMLRLGAERSFHFPTKEFRENVARDDPFAGAFVMEPTCKGIVSGVHVADFASLYPAIIITWNMSPETKRGIPVNGPVPPGHCRSPLTGIGFATDVEGMLPAACKTMIAMRKKWSELAASLPPGTPEAKEAQRRSMAYKVAVNSFYGVVGSPFSRFFDRSVAESVTQNGVWLIKRTIFEASERGMDVVYGDTDSFFAMKVSSTEFGEFVKWCNAELYPKLLATVGCNPDWNAIKLAYEKEFSVLLMVTKKRYSGVFAHYKGTSAKPIVAEGEAYDKKKHSKPEIKGLEFKRGDAAVLAARLQERVIMTAMRGVTRPEPYREILASALAHVSVEDLPLSEIQLSKSLSKAPKDYHRKSALGNDVAVPPHVKVAEKMIAAGAEIGEGSRIAYVVVDGSDGIEAIAAADYAGELDRYYLWDNLVYPPTQRVLEAAFPDEDWKTGLERTRPYKQRKGLPAKVPAEQGSLFANVIPPAIAALPEIRLARDEDVVAARDRITGAHRELIERLADGGREVEKEIAASFERTLEWEIGWRE